MLWFQFIFSFFILAVNDQTKAQRQPKNPISANGPLPMSSPKRSNSDAIRSSAKIATRLLWRRRKAIIVGEIDIKIATQITIVSNLIPFIGD